MLGTIVKYGIICGVTMSALFQAIYLIFGQNTENYRIAEYLGYLVIFGSLAGLFFAIREYRNLKGGGLNFGQGFGLGVATSGVTGLVFILYLLVYFTILDPEMLQTLYDANVRALEMKYQGPALQQQLVNLEQMKFMMLNPGIVSFLFGLIVAFFGVILSVFFALLLRQEAPANS